MNVALHLYHQTRMTNAINIRKLEKPTFRKCYKNSSATVSLVFVTGFVILFYAIQGLYKLIYIINIFSKKIFKAFSNIFVAFFSTFLTLFVERFFLTFCNSYPILSQKLGLRLVSSILWVPIIEDFQFSVLNNTLS